MLGHYVICFDWEDLFYETTARWILLFKSKLLVFALSIGELRLSILRSLGEQFIFKLISVICSSIIVAFETFTYLIN